MSCKAINGHCRRLFTAHETSIRIVRSCDKMLVCQTKRDTRFESYALDTHGKLFDTQIYTLSQNRTLNRDKSVILIVSNSTGNNRSRFAHT